MRRAWLALFVCVALPVQAAPMTKSLLPQPRPGATLPATALPQVASDAAILKAAPAALVLRPRARPERFIVAAAPALREPNTAPEARPLPRPEGLVDVSAARPVPEKSGGLFGKRKKKDTAPVRGSVCGDADIRGEILANIGSKVKGCGVDDPVRITAIDGVRLSPAATIDCTAATALKKWINGGLRPAYKGREVVELKIAGSYTCRPRNNVKGAKISEHGRGRAIDIAGIVTSDGRTQMVAGGYDKKMRAAYKAGCGVFTTTLGPGSDGYHEDHLHFDVASNRTKAYCR